MQSISYVSHCVMRAFRVVYFAYCEGLLSRIFDAAHLLRSAELAHHAAPFCESVGRKHESVIFEAISQDVKYTTDDPLELGNRIKCVVQGRFEPQYHWDGAVSYSYVETTNTSEKYSVEPPAASAPVEESSDLITLDQLRAEFVDHETIRCGVVHYGDELTERFYRNDAIESTIWMVGDEYTITTLCYASPQDYIRQVRLKSESGGEDPTFTLRSDERTEIISFIHSGRHYCDLNGTVAPFSSLLFSYDKEIRWVTQLEMDQFQAIRLDSIERQYLMATLASMKETLKPISEGFYKIVISKPDRRRAYCYSVSPEKEWHLPLEHIVGKCEQLQIHPHDYQRYSFNFRVMWGKEESGYTEMKDFNPVLELDFCRGFNREGCLVRVAVEKHVNLTYVDRDKLAEKVTQFNYRRP